MSALDPREQLDRIAEYADSSIRILNRRGSLVGVPGSYGVKRWLYQRYGNRGNAVYTFVGSLLAIGLSGFCAWLFKEPLLFPSLGATAFLFFETPLAEVGTPRNAIIGHGVAIVAALASLAAFGLLNAPSVYQQGVTPSADRGRRLLGRTDRRGAPPLAGGASSSGRDDDHRQLGAAREGASDRRGRCRRPHHHGRELGAEPAPRHPAPVWAPPS